MSYLSLQKANIGYTNPLIIEANAELDLGEVCLLMGNNGIGKTTLIKSILGQIQLLSGNILIKEKSIKHLDFKTISEQIAIVFSKSEIPINYTVTDLISLGKYNQYTLYFKLKEEDKLEVERIIDKLNLNDYKSQKLTKLSDGNLQKAFIGRALAQNSPFIILDEPTTHLDEENKLMILSLLRTLSLEEQKLILFSSHDWRLAKEFSDKIWWIKDQKLINGIAENIILNNSEILKPKLLNFNKNFVSPNIIAPILEKELMFSYLQKNFFTDLKNFELRFENEVWIIKSDNIYDKSHDFKEIKQIIENSINQ